MKRSTCFIAFLSLSLINAAQAVSPPVTSETSPNTTISIKPELPSSRADILLARFNDASDPYVFVVAHRGDWRNYPENSLAGIDHAIRMGVDMIETDLRRTRDGKFVILHDKTLDRTTTGTGPVSDYTLEQLAGIHLKDALGRPTPHHLPTLEQVLNLTRDRALIYLDKTEDCIPEVHAELQRLGATKHAFFYGKRSPEALRQTLGPIASQINYLPKLDPAQTDPDKYVLDMTKGFRATAFIFEFDRDDAPTLNLIPTLQKSHVRAWASPIDTSLTGQRNDERAAINPDETWGWLISKGMTVLCTDRPLELITYLRSRHLHD